MTTSTLRKTAPLLLSVAAALLLGACGDDRQPVGDGGGSGSADGGGQRKDSAPAPKVCPDAVGKLSASCTREGLVCEFGEDPRPSCRTKATCTGGSWQVDTPSCPGLPPATCPATREEASGNKCTTMDAYCTYPGELVCHCTNCTEYPVQFCKGDPTWRCDAPNPDEACPAGKPKLGSPCSAGDKTCSYGCGGDGARRCESGAWVAEQGGPCPVSTRRLKKDIAYLDAKQLSKLARRALSMKLATYRYKDPAYGVGPQLGFILEDVGKSFAGDPRRGRVNLYGYTSMLLATVQAQQRAIDALRGELRALRTRVTGKRKRTTPKASARAR